MVLTHFGQPTTLLEAVVMLECGRDGATAQQILDAARRRGLEGKGLRVEPAHIAELVCSGPVIAHYSDAHFVVVVAADSRRFTVIDPAAGHMRLTPAEFAARFSGVVLQFVPSASFALGRSSVARVWRSYLWHLLRRRHVRVLGTGFLASTLLVAGIGMLPALLTFRLVRAGSDLDNSSVAVVIAATTFAVVVTTAARGWLLVQLRRYLDNHLTSTLLGHLLRLPWRTVSRRSSGDLLSRIAGLASLREVAASAATSAIVDIPMVVVYGAAIALASPELGGVLLLMGAVQALNSAASMRRLADSTATEAVATVTANAVAVESLVGIATVKAMSLESDILNRWRELASITTARGLRRGWIEVGVLARVEAINRAFPLIFLWAAVSMTVAGRVTFETTLAIAALASGIASPVSSLLSTMRSLSQARVEVRRIGEVLAIETEPISTSASKPALSGAVELRNLRFSYDRDREVLRGIDLDVAPGEVVGICGPSGAGKSTLCLLLLGMLEPTSGEVSYDGSLASDLGPWLRSQVGVVPQDPHVWSGSIGENVRLGRPTASNDDVHWALAVAQLADDVARMPLGVDTPIGPRGVAVSGGQRQRLALARAIVRRPRVLLLDEATSFLDPALEERVDRALRDLECTRIVIAHRASTLERCDRVIRISDGLVAPTRPVDDTIELELLDATA